MTRTLISYYKMTWRFFPPPKRSEAPFDEVDEVHNEAFVKKDDYDEDGI